MNDTFRELFNIERMQYRKDFRKGLSKSHLLWNLPYVDTYLVNYIFMHSISIIDTLI